MRTLFIAVSTLLCTTAVAQDTLLLDAAHIEDAWIWSWPNVTDVNFGEPNTANQGLNNVCRMETWQWSAGRFDTIQNLMRFDFSQLPANVEVLSATLNLKHYSNPNFQNHIGNNELEVALVTDSWQEGQVTWSSRPTYVTVSSLMFPASVSATQDYSLNITALADTIVQSGQPWSILLKLQTENDFAALSFASSEHTDAALRPELEVVYAATSSVGKGVRQESSPAIWLNQRTGLLHAQLNAAAAIEVYSVAGNVVFASAERRKNWQIPVQDWKPGAYLVRTGSGSVVKVLR